MLVLEYLLVGIAVGKVSEALYMQGLKKPDRMPQLASGFVDLVTLGIYLIFVVSILFTAWAGLQFFHARKESASGFGKAGLEVLGGILAMAVSYIAASVLSGTFDIIKYIHEQLLAS